MSNSLWLEEALSGEKDAPPLEHEDHADVCIVGGGFTGLWTALRLKEDAPGLDVVLVEADVCGGGPSGRNGGFVMSMWSKILKLEHLCGDDEALRVARAAAEAVTAIGEFCGDNGIDADYRYDGWLWAATTEAQLGAWDETVEAAQRLGVEAFQRLDPEEAAARGGSPTHLAGVFEPTCATVQPARLARGLRQVALDRGVRIFEHSPMTKLERSRPPRVHTTLGAVTAGTVVLAMNAWLAQAARAVAVARRHRERHDRHRAGSGAPGGDRPDERHRDLRLPAARQLLPHDARRTHRVRARRRSADAARSYRRRVLRRLATCGGHRGELPHDLPGSRRRGDPEQLDGSDRPIARRPPVLRQPAGSARPPLRRRILGNGVGPAYLGGRILASLALGLDDEWTRSPLAQGPHGRFPPGPIKDAGAPIVRAAVARKERAEDEGRRPGRVSSFVAGLAPAGLVPVKKR